jgi:hypothetical protein
LLFSAEMTFVSSLPPARSDAPSSVAMILLGCRSL